MSEIQNSWIKKDKLPKVKKAASPVENKHVTKTVQSNMHMTLRGTRK